MRSSKKKNKIYLPKIDNFFLLFSKIIIIMRTKRINVLQKQQKEDAIIIFAFEIIYILFLFIDRSRLLVWMKMI